MSGIIALLTDYGYTDTYVGQLKAVLMQRAPQARLLDLTHGIPAGNRRSGAYLLMTAIPHLPDGTHIVAVVDPGVGTARRAVAVQASRHRYIAPDNGLLSLAMRIDPFQRAVVLDNPRYFLPELSATFHGRDLFAPVAAHLCNGTPLEQLGTPIDPASLHQLDSIDPEISPDGIRTHLLHIDGFGNLIFDLSERQFRAWLSGDGEVTIRFRGVPIPLRRTFGEVAVGEPVAYFGSSGHLEIALNQGSAAAHFGVRPTEIATAEVSRSSP